MNFMFVFFAFYPLFFIFGKIVIILKPYAYEEDSYKSFVFDVLRMRLLLSGNDKVSVRLPVQEIPFSKDLRQRQFDDSGNPRS